MLLALGVLHAYFSERGTQQLSFFHPELVLVQSVYELLGGVIAGEEVGTLGVGDLLNELLFRGEGEGGGEGGK
jgi:hypothetical protein